MSDKATFWRLPKGVWILGGVSLLNDMATESVYPLLPFFLTTVLGAGAVSLGVIEGAAEAVASVLKVISGRLSDRWNRRKPIVVAGYGVSAAARPFIGLAGSWITVFVLRFIDRVGKGVRGAPRDAMLAELADQTNRGRVYGFHQAMDHIGAVVGPLLATAFLVFYPGRYRMLFALTAIPGALTVLLLRWAKEPETAPPVTRDSGLGIRDSGIRTPLPRPLVQYLIVLSIFMLGNSSDAFLLLRLTDAAGGPKFIPLLWAALHVVKTVSSVVGGSASDRFGRRRLIAGGWTVYALVYVGFALSASLTMLVVWFMLYGVYYGCVEGSERALIADFALPSQKGTAFGIYNGVAGLGALISSVVFGVLWKMFGPAVAFTSGAALAIAAAILLFILVPAPVLAAAREV
ncbi:MAG TPA: MFS transporter [Vicinamibacterales bacterium]|nr:MFS transporter [Vicinamibacterales bacterium]